MLTRHVFPAPIACLSVSPRQPISAKTGHFVEQFTDDWSDRWSPSSATKEDRNQEVFSYGESPDTRCVHVDGRATQLLTPVAISLSQSESGR